MPIQSAPPVVVRPGGHIDPSRTPPSITPTGPLRNEGRCSRPPIGPRGARTVTENTSSPPASGADAAVAFRCNVCGCQNVVPGEKIGREIASCAQCGSWGRARAIVRCLSLVLFRRALALPDMPADRLITGIGLSDWDGYAAGLARLFSYRNTFFHAPPRLDITAPPVEMRNSLDFLISSEVFEHIPPPVEGAFAGAFDLLKPGGALILSVPYSKLPQTIEHFPDLHRFEVVRRGERHVLVNHRRDGRREEFDDLVFHGGPGAVLEMRVFCEQDLIARLQQAGFRRITIHGEDDPSFGVINREDWSLPVTAIKPL